MAEQRRSAVSFYPTDHPALNIGLKKGLSELLDEQRIHLDKAQDWADFKFRCGVVHGLETAIAMCDQLFERLNDPR